MNRVMKLFLLPFTLLFCAFDHPALAQKTKGGKEALSCYQMVGGPVTMPRYKAGKKAMQDLLLSQLKYPRQVQAEGVEGDVYVSLLITSAGKVVQPKIERGAGTGMDEEALRLVGLLGPFIPAHDAGGPLPMRAVLKVPFRLPGKPKASPEITYKPGADPSDVLTIDVEPEEPKVEEADEDVFYAVEQMPRYPGGIDAYQEYIKKNLVYPPKARAGQIEGAVYIEVLVLASGKLAGAKVVKKVGFGMDEEALRLINSIERFEPGRQKGKPVKLRMVVPVRFSLN